jgi:hypothetical protein
MGGEAVESLRKVGAPGSTTASGERARPACPHWRLADEPWRLAPWISPAGSREQENSAGAPSSTREGAYAPRKHAQSPSLSNADRLFHRQRRRTVFHPAHPSRNHAHPSRRGVRQARHPSYGSFSPGCCGWSRGRDTDALRLSDGSRHRLPSLAHATISFTTWPCTSVRRKSRPA